MGDMSDAEIREARADLAAAFRWAARLGLNEGVCNHFSLAVSAAGDRFLVNPWGFHFSEIRASDLLLVNPDGTVEGGDVVEPTAFHIHSRIHAAVPQARCVLHTHMPYATALTSVEGATLEPIHQTALRFHDQIAYDGDYGGLALDQSEGDRIASRMGNRQVLFMANHGVTVVGPSVAHAFDRLYYLERACQNQVLALSTGLPLKRVPEEVVRHTAHQAAQEEGQSLHHFRALKRILDREAPEYRH